LTVNDRTDWMWSEACALIARAERLNQEFFRPAVSAAWQPPVDILETERAIWILVALPGVESSDVQVSIDGNVLSIVGIRRLPEIARGAAVHRLEIPNGRFERRIQLPATPLEISRPQLRDGCLFLSATKRMQRA
jgi:HSP20 family protein